jgi:hypothetical protein
MSSRQSGERHRVGVGTHYRTIVELLDDRTRVQKLADALEVTRKNVSKDNCDQWTIFGRSGHMRTLNDRYLLYFEGRSSRHWGAIKRKCKPLGLYLTQDGDDEGCFCFDLPSPATAKFLRKLLGLRKRRVPPPAEGLSRGVSPAYSRGFEHAYAAQSNAPVLTPQTV